MKKIESKITAEMIEKVILPMAASVVKCMQENNMVDGDSMVENELLTRAVTLLISADIDRVEVPKKSPFMILHGMLVPIANVLGRFDIPELRKNGAWEGEHHPCDMLASLLAFLMADAGVLQMVGVDLDDSGEMPDVSDIIEKMMKDDDAPKNDKDTLH